MGRERKELHIYTYVSRHNSDDDKRDDSLLEELETRIRLICREHRYESLEIDLTF